MSINEELLYRPSARELAAFRFRKVLLAVSGLPGMSTLSRLLIKTGTRIDNFRNLRDDLRDPVDPNAEQPAGANMRETDFEAGYGYESEFREIEIADYYRGQIEAGDLQGQRTESGQLYDAIFRAFEDHLSPLVTKVVNFGVSYGYVDATLARRFPDIQFYGVDRSELTKRYNEEIFGELPNLHFVAGDVFEFLESQDFDNAALLHARTLTLLPKGFVEKLYAAAAAAGFGQVFGFEQCGISWQTGRPYVFDEDPDRPSVYFRNGMFIHNYPGLLKTAGFGLERATLIKSNHPDPTYRLAHVVGTRPA